MPRIAVDRCVLYLLRSAVVCCVAADCCVFAVDCCGLLWIAVDCCGVASKLDWADASRLQLDCMRDGGLWLTTGTGTRATELAPMLSC